jgi:hypothetical protein
MNNELTTSDKLLLNRLLMQHQIKIDAALSEQKYSEFKNGWIQLSIEKDKVIELINKLK